MKAEQIYDEDFADRTGPWIGSKRRQWLWQKAAEVDRAWYKDYLAQRNQYAQWLCDRVDKTTL